MSHKDCELILVDVYWTKGSVYTDTNQFKSCYESFQAEYSWLQKAIQKNLVQLPNIREVFALGGLGKHAQSYHRKHFEKENERPYKSWRSVA